MDDLARLAVRFEVEPHPDWFALQSVMDGISGRDALPWVADVAPMMGPLSATESVDLYSESMGDPVHDRCTGEFHANRDAAVSR